MSKPKAKCPGCGAGIFHPAGTVPGLWRADCNRWFNRDTGEWGPNTVECLECQLVGIRRERGEARTALEAWQKAFGTSQLTHAQAEVARLREERKNPGVELAALRLQEALASVIVLREVIRAAREECCKAVCARCAEGDEPHCGQDRTGHPVWGHDAIPFERVARFCNAAGIRNLMAASEGQEGGGS